MADQAHADFMAMMEGDLADLKKKEKALQQGDLSDADIKRIVGGKVEGTDEMRRFKELNVGKLRNEAEVLAAIPGWEMYVASLRKHE
jgi:hypothetical protein